MKILPVLLLLLIGCQNSEIKPQKKVTSENKVITEKDLPSHSEKVSLSDSSLAAVDRFMHFILDSNLRYIAYAPADQSVPEYLKMFSHAGLDSVYTYSRKNYPKNHAPVEYQHFSLFILKYENDSTSTAAFSKLMRTMDFRKGKNDIPFEEVETMRFYAKYGGLIAKKDNYILNLVESCGGPGNIPFKTWEEYENHFLKAAFNNDFKDLIVLDADCGMDYFETIIYFDDVK